MLKLRGTAHLVKWDDISKRFMALRLKRPENEAKSIHDAAIIRNLNDLNLAKKSGHEKIIYFGENPKDPQAFDNFRNYIIAPNFFSYFEEGDIIGIEPEKKRIRSLYRINSTHNSFFVTERCNHYCLMCSQPPRNVNDHWLLDEIIEAIPLVSSETVSFAFTGGEPLLDWKKFLEILELCKFYLPNTIVHVLTNGRAFADSNISEAWSKIDHHHLTAAIPIYSAIDHIHDYVVQSKGALNESIIGILKLKERGQRVEIRVVLHSLTAKRVHETCSWLARNLPFVDHVAIMGLENTGFALANEELLSIDPLDYALELEEAVKNLVSNGINVSVYNLPRCLVPRSIWAYCIRSISDWKQGYLPECDGCLEKNNCSGFFQTGRPKLSRGLKAIK